MKQKMVATVLITILLAGMCLTGCQTEQGEGKENSTTTQKSELLADMKEEYYMLSVSDYEGDIEEILEYLIEDYDIYEDKIQTTEEKEEKLDAGLQTEYTYTLETGGPAYMWVIDDPNYRFRFSWSKYADGVIDSSAPSASVTDTKETKKIAMDVAELFDADLELYKEELVQNYDINNKPAEEVAIYDFRQTYDNAPLAYAAFIDGGQKILFGPGFSVVVDGNGLCRISSHDFVEVGEPIQTYHSKEFISLEEVERKIQSYCSSFHVNIGIEDYEMKATIESGEIVYIPYIEQNEKVLIPAYELMVIEDQGEEIWRMHYIVDVFTGYVYYRTGVDQLS